MEVVGEWYFKICFVFFLKLENYLCEWLVRYLLFFEVKIYLLVELCVSVKSDKVKCFC